MINIKKILIADDHSIVARGLHYIISLNFTDCQIAQVSSLKELTAALSSDNFTHLILDINLDDGNSLDILPRIIESYPDLQILIYSMMPEEIFGQKLMGLGISGFLSKKSTEQEVSSALQVYLNGGIFLSRKLKKAFDTGGSMNVFQSLSLTEVKVLGHILKGKKTKEIAGELKVSQQAIATFKSRIFKKLGTDNIFEIQKLTELHNINLS